MIEIGFAVASGLAWLLVAVALALHWRAWRADARFLDAFWSGGAMEDLRPIAARERHSPAGTLFAAIMRELDQMREHPALPSIIGRAVDAVRLERAPTAWADALWILAAVALTAGAAVAFLADTLALSAGGAVAAQALILGTVIARREAAAARVLEAFGHTLTRLVIKAKSAAVYETR